MVQFTMLAAMVGLPMLVLASPLQPSPDVSALSPTSHVKRTGATGPVEAVNAVETQSGSNCPAVSTVVVTSTVTAPNDNKTPPGGAASSSKPSANPTDKTSGPLSAFSGPLSCFAIQTNNGDDWFTTALCALFSVTSNQVRKSIDVNKGTFDDAGSAVFSVYDLDLKMKQFSVDYKEAAGLAFDNFRESWVAGGFKKAIMSTGGAGVVKDGLFNCTANSSDKKVADAGEWGLEYLTGKKAEKIEITKDTKDWGMSSSQGRIEANKSVDDWVGKIGQHPMTVLTNDKPAKGLKPNRYYSLYSTVAKDKNSFNVWYTTHSDDTYEDNVATAIIKVDLGEMKTGTQYLYHLKDWASL
nr:hypothetical protein L204_01854 [Cryptococcus depauperatus CBS 7855]